MTRLGLALLLLLIPSAIRAQEANAGFKVPPGFRVALYADDNLATDIFSLTIDAKGRVVVAGKNYVKILEDTDGDGKADRANLFSDKPASGAHGMVFDGPDLICTGDKGVRRYIDSDGDGRCDTISETWVATTNDNEHAANGIVKGPDGWFYVITGNDAGITAKVAATPTSPVKTPNSGTVIRISPDGKQSEIVAHGFRNPYDLAFGPEGHLFTVDSDGERIHGLPYYTPNRLFDIAQGMHHGWILPGWQSSWSRPQSWPDNVERLVEIGRGSPTGVHVYRHRMFPEKYRGGVFSLCWTFGRVYFFPMKARGSTFDGKLEVFMETTGDVGFAPTDMAVGPKGDLFISIGGRGTRGSVFRVWYEGAADKSVAASESPSDLLTRVLTADEPLSSWSRAKWIPLAQKLGKTAFTDVAMGKHWPVSERIRAVDILTERFDGISLDDAVKLFATTPSDPLRARLAWSVSRTHLSDRALTLLMDVAHASSEMPRAGRAAWEALACSNLSKTMLHREPSFWSRALSTDDRRARAAAVLASRGPLAPSFLAADGTGETLPIPRTACEKLALGLATFWHPKNPPDNDRLRDTCVKTLQSEVPLWLKMEAVRLLQWRLGDVTGESGEKSLVGFIAPPNADWTEADRQRLSAKLTTVFPTGSAELDRELARLLAMLGEPADSLLEHIARQWDRASVQDDLHYLFAAARIPGKRSPEVVEKTARAFNGTILKLAAQGIRPADQVPTILEGLFDRHLRLAPELGPTLLQDPAFGAPGHELFARRLPTNLQATAARKMLSKLAKLDGEARQAAWNPDLIALVAMLPDKESLPILREQAGRYTDTVTLLLAPKRLPEDRSLLIKALSSTQANVVAAAATALHGTPDKATPAEVAVAIRALRRYSAPKTGEAARTAVGTLLSQWTGQSKAGADAAAVNSAWSKWFLENHPKDGETLLGMAGANTTAWRERLNKVVWEKGDEKRGAAIFLSKSCARCHGEQRRLGPDLTGAGQRFSRDDLFTAIIDPSKDIAPAYTPTAIVTHQGKTYHGVLIYTSPQLYLLQTSPDVTARITGEEVQSIQPGRISFMPAGLLDGASDQELADLWAFLRNHRKK